MFHICICFVATCHQFAYFAGLTKTEGLLTRFLKLDGGRMHPWPVACPMCRIGMLWFRFCLMNQHAWYLHWLLDKLATRVHRM